MRWLKAASIPLACIASAAVVALGLDLADSWLEHAFMGTAAVPAWQTAVYAAVWLFTPLSAGILVAWSLRDWVPWTASINLGHRGFRTTYGALVIGYWLTACVGVPMIETELTQMVRAQRRFEQAVDDSGVLPYQRVNSANEPWSRTALAVPILPGIVVVYHEYQASRMNGRGAFYVFLWSGTSVRELTSFSRWVS